MRERHGAGGKGVKALLAVLLVLLAVPARADDPAFGLWRTGARDGSWGIVEMQACGTKLCGILVGGGGRHVDKRYFGTVIVRDMTRAGSDYYGGQIFDAERGQWYISKMRLDGPDRLTVKGCVLGGLICGGQVWERQK